MHLPHHSIQAIRDRSLSHTREPLVCPRKHLLVLLRVRVYCSQLDKGFRGRHLKRAETPLTFLLVSSGGRENHGIAPGHFAYCILVALFLCGMRQKTTRTTTASLRDTLH